MQVVITGIGDAFSTHHHGSSAVVMAPEGQIAIDCPGSVMAMYREAAATTGLPLGVGHVDDVLLTHLHGDHSNGLEVLGFARRYLHEPCVRPRLHALPEVLSRVWEKLAPAMDGATRSEGPMSTIEDYFELCPLEPGSSVEIAGVSVEVRRAMHSVPTAGLLIRSATGTLGWSGDTEFEMEHIDWLSQADCIVHECGEHFKHTHWSELDTLPEHLKQKIQLIHLPDHAEVPEGPMQPLRAGEVLEIGNC